LTVTAGPSYDTGTVTLTVNGVTAASTSYGQNSTPETVAAGLAGNVATGSPVTVLAVNDAVYLQSTGSGSTADYSYALQVTSNNPTVFPEPSFASASGSLDGGGNQGSGAPTVYFYDLLYQANGNVAGYNDAVMGTWAPSYDTLNRLITSTGSQTGNSFTNYCWSYDNFGNRTSQESSAGTFQSGSGGFSACVPQNPAPLTYNTNNQVSGGPSVPSYDQAGNVTADNNGDGNSYLYDAEGRICAVQTAAVDGINIWTGYIYDAEGRRIAKGTITSWSCDPSANGFGANANETDYILDQADHQVTEMASDANGAMAWAHTNVWAGGQLLGTYSAILNASNLPDGALHFYFNDWLGTRRAQTDYAGVLESTCATLPFGDTESCPPAPSEATYTSKERDSESGNDYFGARYYASPIGRFLSPDPLLSSGNPGDPQTWNRYAYGSNNPLRVIDPTGLWDWDQSVGGDMSDDDLELIASDKHNKRHKWAKSALNFRNDFRTALDAADEAAGSPLLSDDEQAAAQSGVDAYGTEGDGNGVNVGIDSTSGASTILNDNDTFSVKFGSGILNNAGFLAVTVDHEGIHVAQGNAWLDGGESSAADINHYMRETAAWTVGSNLARALGMKSLAPYGGGPEYQVWNRGWKAPDVETMRAKGLGNIMNYMSLKPTDTGTYSSEHHHKDQ
jgi:RHS repeat-associated protein